MSADVAQKHDSAEMACIADKWPCCNYTLMSNFDLLWCGILQELVPLMQPALTLFLSLLDGPDVGVSKDVLVELCLLLPLELEKKYPVLPKLMKPLVMALKAESTPGRQVRRELPFCQPQVLIYLWTF